MTNDYRSLTRPCTGAHTAAIHTIERATLLVLCLAVAAWLCFAVHQQSAIGTRTLILARGAIVTGMSRVDCYRWLRAHHLTATNIAFAKWSKNAFGIWYRSNDGAWPAGRANPDVEVTFAASSLGGCGMTMIETISFDHLDRIARVVPSEAYWSCR